MPARIFPGGVLDPHPAVIEIKTRLCRRVFNHAADQKHPGLRLTLSASDVIAIEPAVYRLLAASKVFRKLVPVPVRAFSLDFRYFLFGKVDLSPGHILSHDFRHVFILETKDARDIHRQKAAGLDNGEMKFNDPS